MRYAYRDLGEQPAGSTAVVRWSGGAASVILLDPVNFSKYRHCNGRPFFYDGGGHYGRPPARLSIPQDGRWYIVVDLGGYAGAAPTVELFAPEDAKPRAGSPREKVA
jgi:hypothetical protein